MGEKKLFRLILVMLLMATFSHSVLGANKELNNRVSTNNYGSCGNGITGLAAADNEAYSPWIDIVKDYHADNSGTKDVSKIINQAIKDHPGATIYFPAGDYLIKNQISYQDPELAQINYDSGNWGCTLSGESPEQSRLHLATKDGVDTFLFDSGDRVRITALTFANENQCDRNMIFVKTHAWDLTISNCIFENCIKGIEIENGGYSYVKNCTFTSDTDNCEYMIFQSLDKNSTASQTNEYAYIEDCLFKGEAKAQILFDGLKYSSVTGCTFRKTTGAGIRLTAKNSDCFNNAFDQNAFIEVGKAFELRPDANYISRIAISNCYFNNVDSILWLKNGNKKYDRAIDIYGCTAKKSKLITSEDIPDGYFDIYNESSESLGKKVKNNSRKENPIYVYEGGIVDETTLNTRPELQVTNSSDKVLKEGEDYICFRTSETKFTVVGVGEYTGTASAWVISDYQEELPVYNVLDAGADNKGKKDISKVVNAILKQNMDKNFILYFPRGNYLVQSPIEIKNENLCGVVLMGEGKQKTIFSVDCAAIKEQIPIKINNGNGVSLHGFSIKSKNKDMNLSGSTPMIHAENAGNISLERLCICAFMEEFNGIRLYDADGATINQCNFNRDAEIPVPISNMLYIKDSKNVRINDCAFEGAMLTQSGCGIYANKVKELTITNTDFCNWYKGTTIKLSNKTTATINSSVFMRNLYSIRHSGDSSSLNLKNISVWTGDLEGTKYIIKADDSEFKKVTVSCMNVSCDNAKIITNANKSSARIYRWYNTKLSTDLDED